jgi:hypothetical protein
MLRILVISTQGYFSESLHAVMFHVRLDNATMYLMFFALLLILSAF